MMISTLMTKSNNVVIVGLLAIIVTILLATTLQQTTTLAQSTEDSVNDVSLRVVFQFFEGEEEVNTFQSFNGYCLEYFFWILGSFHPLG